MKKMIIIAFVLNFMSCQHNISKEIRLKQRVNAYHVSLIKGEYASSWSFLWHDAKRRHSLDDWVLFCQRSDSEKKLIEYKIKSFSISRVKKGTYLAKVNLVGRHEMTRLGKVEEIKGEDEWVFENGDWYRYID